MAVLWNLFGIRDFKRSFSVIAYEVLHLEELRKESKELDKKDFNGYYNRRSFGSQVGGVCLAWERGSIIDHELMGWVGRILGVRTMSFILIR